MESENMARITFEEIMAGLNDAHAYTYGDIAKGAAHQVQIP